MKIVYIVIGLMFLFGCSEDKGSYDYRTLNSIALSGLEKEYAVDQFDTLRIDDLKMDFALEENADLAFEWVMRRANADLNTARVISTDRNCRGYIEEVPGNYRAYLCVTDKTNNLKYYRQFNVVVNTVWANGLYVLSEAADGTAVLSMQRRDKPDQPLIYDVFGLNNPDLGALGKKPVQVCRGDMFSSDVFILCREGERKLSRLDYDDLKLRQYWDESTVEGYTGSFCPEYFSNEQGHGMVMSEGKLFVFNYSNNHTLGWPVEGYRFSWVGTNPSLSNHYYAYDEESQTFKHLQEGRIAMSYDDVETIDELNTAGQVYRSSAKMILEDFVWIQYPVLYDPATGLEHYYEIHIGGDYTPDWDYITFFNYSEKMARPALLEEDGACLLSKSSYWYVSRGNKVIRFFFSENSAPQDWITGLKGRVTDMIFGNDETRIFVATYDGSKSYIYEIDARNAGKHLNEPIEVEGKVVSLCVMNGSDWKY